eukprot:Hpha_TRINITY_DN22706_c0_g1::TRINITY_DN22706_c0_g1_i1::g.34214::m.34214/K12196/VPS4; vacuolar protein-sorting-associated protein 4
MTHVDFTKNATDLVRQAAEKDNAGEYASALSLYTRSLEYFQAAIRHEKEQRKVKMLKEKAEEISDRALQIKKWIDEGQQSGGGGGSAQAQKGKKNQEENEDAKMRGALESSIISSKPDVKWSDVAGLEAAKSALREAVVLPTKFPQLFTGERRPWKGILMYGPPGTGKSYLASAVATECESTFFKVSSADIMSKWVGESEKLVRTLFKLAREQKPSVIFIDEVDSLCSARGSGDNESGSRVKTEFLVQMQGVGHDDLGLLVLAATNLPYQLDSAIRRRFERRIEIPLPDVEARKEMFKIHLGDTPNDLRKEQFEELARRADGYSGSDISVLVRNALMEPVRTCQLAMHFKEVPGPDPEDPSSDKIVTRLMPCSPGDPAGKEMTLLEVPEPHLVIPPPVQYDDFIKAFITARPSVSQKDLIDVNRFTQEFGQGEEPRDVAGVACQTETSWVHSPKPVSVPEHMLR